jgi:hypothetical protein
MRRFNSLRGLHRLLVVLWIMWVAIVIGQKTWEWRMDPWRESESGIWEAGLTDGSKIQVQIPCKNVESCGGQEALNKILDTEFREGRWRSHCCWKPWSYLRYEPMLALRWLVIGPGAIYVVLMALAIGFRWVWQGFMPKGDSQ